MWQDVARFSSFESLGFSHLIIRTMQSSQWARKCPDPARQDDNWTSLHFFIFYFFLRSQIHCYVPFWNPRLRHSAGVLPIWVHCASGKPNVCLKKTKTSRNMTCSVVYHRHHRQHYTHYTISEACSIVIFRPFVRQRTNNCASHY